MQTSLELDINSRFGYRRPVIDLGDARGEHFRGIYTPVYDDAIVRRYVQAQFLENAEHYAKNWQNVSLFKACMELGLDFSACDRRPGLSILDLGSGAGNSIFPLLELLPGCSMVASDLSLEMLRLLKNELKERGVYHNCCLLQLNAEELDFAPETFDLVVGASILHHLHDPDHTVKGCARILHKGGHAIFFEPFAEGHILVRDTLEAILADSRSVDMPIELKSFFNAQILDTNARLGTDKTDPRYKHMDDKWLFPNSFFPGLAQAYGFTECKLKSMYWGNQVIRDKMVNLLAHGVQQLPEYLPAWGWQIIYEHDMRAYRKGESEPLIEACVVLTK